MVKYPVYIPSKGRSESCLTADILQSENIDFNIVVEPQDADGYIDIYGADKCLIMEHNDYGIAYARNWIKKHSTDRGEGFHWQIDDNIKSFRVRRNNKNQKIEAGYCLTEVERYNDAHCNIGISGLCHTAFAFSHKTDYGFNKQVYSCVLVRNELPLWWRDGLVEDTDYSLQVLTLGDNNWCTVLFHRLLIEKAKTMSMKGGNTEIEYSENGRLIRSLGLQKQWPGAFKISKQYGRVKVLPSRIWRTFQQRPIPINEVAVKQ